MKRNKILGWSTNRIEGEIKFTFSCCCSTECKKIIVLMPVRLNKIPHISYEISDSETIFDVCLLDVAPGFVARIIRLAELTRQT